MSIKGFIIPAGVFICVATLVAQPKIKPVPSIDLGDSFQGQKIEHVVSIDNVGKDTLRIAEVKAQCGCTATLMSEKTIAPNGSGKLNFTFDTHNYTGKVTKQIYITSNDTATPKLIVSFSANVIQVLSINPQFLAFDNVKVDSVYTKTILITNPSPKEAIEILGIAPKLENLTVTLKKNTLKPGEQVEAQAVYRAKATGTFQGTVELQTNHPRSPKFEIRCYASVRR